jgi:hypothetical protein
MELDALEDTVNEITDRDWSWWPFLWLRPEKHVRLSLTRIVSLSVLYGVPCSVLMGFAFSLLRASSLTERLFSAVTFPLLFLFAGSVLVAPMWNRRAERLRARIR